MIRLYKIVGRNIFIIFNGLLLVVGGGLISAKEYKLGCLFIFTGVFLLDWLSRYCALLKRISNLYRSAYHMSSKGITVELNEDDIKEAIK